MLGPVELRMKIVVLLFSFHKGLWATLANFIVHFASFYRPDKLHVGKLIFPKFKDFLKSSQEGN